MEGRSRDAFATDFFVVVVCTQTHANANAYTVVFLAVLTQAHTTTHRRSDGTAAADGKPLSVDS